MLPFPSKKKNYLATANLHACLPHMSVSDVECWLRKGADPQALHTPDSKFYTGNVYHAFAAISHAHIGAADEAVLDIFDREKVDINAVNQSGQTPIHVAARNRHKKPTASAVLRALIAHGAKPNARDDMGNTALHEICADVTSAQGVLLDCVKALLERGAAIDSVDNYGHTPLMMAAQAGHLDVYAFLVAHGANIHRKDKEGLRASNHAFEAGHFAMADHLRSKEESTPETKPSFPSDIVPNVSWDKLGDYRISRTTVEDPIQYRITEIFNFYQRTYTCITQNLTTKAEALTVKGFDDFEDAAFIETAWDVFERKGGKMATGKPVLRRRDSQPKILRDKGL